MSIVGDLIALYVAWVQEASVVLGMGALTITLAAHLSALHSRLPEATHLYVRLAKACRAIALILIIVSGGAGILIRLNAGSVAGLASPIFLFTLSHGAELVALSLLE